MTGGLNSIKKKVKSYSHLIQLNYFILNSTFKSAEH
jgi:hypothetical protein